MPAAAERRLRAQLFDEVDRSFAGLSDCAPFVRLTKDGDDVRASITCFKVSP